MGILCPYCNSYNENWRSECKKCTGSLNGAENPKVMRDASEADPGFWDEVEIATSLVSNSDTDTPSADTSCEDEKE